MRPFNLLPVLPAILLIAACADTTEPDALDEDAEAQTAEAQASAPLAITRESIALQKLDAGDFAVDDLQGRLGCSFSETRGGEPLLLGYAFVATDKGADAAIKVNGKTVPLSMAGAGGYARMADGAVFMGDGLTAEVEVVGTQPLGADPQVARESSSYAAILTVTHMGEGVARSGFWECGP